MTGYWSDECLAMWLLEFGGEQYWFVCNRQHPLLALQFALGESEMDGDLDGLADGFPEEAEDWGIRMMVAEEKFSCHGEDDIGPFKMNDEHQWEGTVKQAVDLCGETEMIICSTAWYQ